MDDSRVERTPPEKENVEPFPPRSGSCKMRMMMMPLEVKRLISESSSSPSSSAVSSGQGASSSPPGPLKNLLSLSSPPSASSTPYIKISPGTEGDSSSRILFRTPGRSSKSRTPSGHRCNPFETGRENLHLPVIMSPSLFATVQSPSQENNGEHFWSLEDRAALFPVQISEDSPWKQEERKLDPETEIKTQEALNHYFDHHHQITSPLTESSSNGPMEVATQTELSFPPKLPEEVEALLAKYNQGNTAADNYYGNLSLRRKLFTNNLDESTSDEEGNEGSTCSEGEDAEAASSPIRLMSPGKVILTPPRRGSEDVANETEGMLSSFTPPLSFTRRTSGALTQIMDSPLFSPISRTNSGSLHESMREPLLAKDEEEESSFFPYFTDSPRSKKSQLIRSVIMEEETFDEEMKSSSIFAPADINMSNIMDTYSAQSSPLKAKEEEEYKKSSTKLTLDNLTSSMTFNDVSEVTLPSNYVTGHSSSSHAVPSSLSTIAESEGPSSVGDSGMVSDNKSSFFHCNPTAVAANKPKSSYLVSYAAGEEGNDISVGFPLGSSTPTKQ